MKRPHVILINDPRASGLDQTVIYGDPRRPDGGPFPDELSARAHAISLSAALSAVDKYSATRVLISVQPVFPARTTDVVTAWAPAARRGNPRKTGGE